jgi:hypothetical protein
LATSLSTYCPAPRRTKRPSPCTRPPRPPAACSGAAAATREALSLSLSHPPSYLSLTLRGRLSLSLSHTPTQLSLPHLAREALSLSLTPTQLSLPHLARGRCRRQRAARQTREALFQQLARQPQQRRGRHSPRGHAQPRHERVRECVLDRPPHRPHALRGFRRCRLALPAFHSKATWFGVQNNRSATLALNFNNPPTRQYNQNHPLLGAGRWQGPLIQ